MAGCDEAGRGCLAGPVVAGAVILPEGFELAGMRDSKKLSGARREYLGMQIKKRALAWSVGFVWQRQIEKINILQATLYAMARAAARLEPLPDTLMIDGNCIIGRDVMRRIWPASVPEQVAVIHGDESIPAISAASILAKMTRDHLMVRLDERWPNYGFARHKGYGTAAHYAALEKYGPCPLHRMTFRGVCQGAPRW